MALVVVMVIVVFFFLICFFLSWGLNLGLVYVRHLSNIPICWKAEEGRLLDKSSAPAHTVLNFHTYLSFGNLVKLRDHSMQCWAMSQLAFRDVCTVGL